MYCLNVYACRGLWLKSDFQIKTWNLKLYFLHQVKWWITINEPGVTAWLGHGIGIHAPGIRDPFNAFFKVSHNLIRAHARAYHLYVKDFRKDQQGHYCNNCTWDVKGFRGGCNDDCCIIKNCKWKGLDNLQHFGCQYRVDAGSEFLITLPLHVLAAWWRHQMETFSAFLALCAGNSPVTGEFPAQRPVTRSFRVILDLRLNKRLSK